MKAPVAKNTNIHQLQAPVIPPAYLAMAQAQMQALGKGSSSPPTADQLTASMKAPNGQ